jgi:hypothetical protein
MNSGIADIFKMRIASLPFVDRLAGIVRVVIMAVESDGGTTKRIAYPIACDVTQADCQAGKYSDLAPNASKKSVIYFEEVAAPVLVNSDGGKLRFRSTVKMVGWLNLLKLGKADCNITPAVVSSILTALPTSNFNSGIYTRIKITGIAEDIKSSAIFSRYSYDEPVMQYLLYPYDYFALNITCEFTISKGCIPEFALGDEACAKTAN